MGKATFVLLFAVVLAVAGGCLFLAYWDPHAPPTRVEKVLPDARFPK